MGCYARVLCSLVVLWMWAANGFAAPCGPWVTRVVSVQGTVEVKRAKQNGWSRVRLNDQFCAGDSIRADLYSRAGLLLRNETLLRLDQGTTLVLPQLYDEDAAWLDLLRGAVHFISNIPYQLKIKTPFVNAAIEGTEFVVRVADSDTKVWVLEGKVSVHNPQGKISLGPGEAAVAEAGKAPVPYLKIKPRDAVQWALYYPPIIDYRPASAADANRQQAVTLYRTGQTAGAIEALNAVPQGNRDASFYSQRAALLLSVGQVQLAEPDIDKAQTMAPTSGSPLALRSVIALTQNDKEKALSLARDAVKREPESPIPQVAMSYAQQAAFNIEGATASIKKALELAPDDPLAWARLSELELSSGELDDALVAAQKAEALDPELSRTQMVLGFAQLMEIDIDEAQQSFNKAIELDPSAPLARLGMGLAKIRQGDVEEGRKDIEVAAVLDPENSLIRSYLGKAYYEEKRGNVANREFQIAKQLDPKDPTPWFYDAIQKQTTNRPVEALHDMQKAIELNDNRAVYRSSLLLDDDLAARSASLGRIYNDLGFQERGLFEGWRSVSYDPSNYSAHRLLADNYAALPRHENARVSELLQSQLLQPINITPVQPRLAESNLLILDGLGPQLSSFNEFNPLFARNRFALQVSGISGSNKTWGDEITQSGLWNNISYSVGQFHFQTDGYRENNDSRNSIYNGFAQIAITPKLNLQGEVRYRDIQSGDLRSRFTGLFSVNRRRVIREESYRAGLRYLLKPDTTLIASFVYNDRDGKTNDEVITPGVSVENIRESDNIRSTSTEVQLIHKGDAFNIRIGGGYFEQKRNDKRFDQFVFNSPFFPPLTVENSDLESQSEYINVYTYLTSKHFDNLLMTLGVSFDSFNQTRGSFQSNDFNPKFGVIWDILPAATIRLAAYKSTKRPLLGNATIEPTQVAGFTQFFDDIDGTQSKFLGAAIDYKLFDQLFGGVEFTWRSLKIPRIGAVSLERQREQMHRAYISWTPLTSIALNLSYRFEKFNISPPNINDDTNPNKIMTHFFPITLNYFHTNGFFAKFGGTFINQSVFFTSTSRKRGGTENFWILDASIGYRLPKRWGLLSVGVKNLLDRDFARFEDINLQTDEPLIPQFQPERTIFGQFTLAF